MIIASEERAVILPLHGTHEPDPCLWRQAFRVGGAIVEIAVFHGRLELIGDFKLEVVATRDGLKMVVGDQSSGGNHAA